MRYPDGTAIKVGDWVWWNEGSCVGVIAFIVEDEQSKDEWGLDQCGIFICNDLLGDLMTFDVFNSEADLEDEAVSRLAANEEREIRKVMEYVKKENPNLFNEKLRHAVRLSTDAEGKVMWEICQLDDNFSYPFYVIRLEDSNNP